MTLARAIFLAMVFVGLALGTIGLRSEQIRVASRIEQMQRERMALRQELWRLQLENGRLRTPSQVRDRVARWSLDVSAPCPPSEPLKERKLASKP